MNSDFAPVPALAGGVLLGLSATVLLLANGRVAGISDILGGLLERRAGDLGWRGAFLVGMVGAGVVAGVLRPELVASGLPRPTWALVLAGLLVGFGTRMGNGCTSGHGICGLSRLSVRSLVNVVTFMLTGGIAAFVGSRLFGEG